MLSVAWAQSPAAAPAGPSALIQFFPFILIFFVFYFLIIRPQKKRQQEHQKLVDALKKGDRVMTSGGLFGTVVGVHDDRVVLKVAENVKVEYQKSAVSSVVTEKKESE